MFNFFHEGVPQTFCYTYKCFSVSMFPGAARQDVENGGKIILPPAALEHLTRLNVVYPMLFKLTHCKTNRVTHCGVLEFVADHSKCYVPYWMMRNILCEEGDLVDIESATLPVANFSKFQPISTEFLDISNPKAILENALRNFACLTTGDCVAIRYNDKVYELRVLETRPGNAVSIIECDMDVEFAPPDDYVEPARIKNEEIFEKENATLQTADVDECERNFLPFVGSGNRLDGKHAGTELESASKRRYRRGIPDYEYKMGTIEFIRTSFSNGVGNKASTKSFVPFAGGGITIRGSTRNEKSDACVS